jgi:hypothetical protein
VISARYVSNQNSECISSIRAAFPVSPILLHLFTVTIFAKR